MLLSGHSAAGLVSVNLENTPGGGSAWQWEVERCLLSLHSYSRSIASEAPHILVRGLFNNNNVFFFCYRHGEDFWVGRRFCFCFLKRSHWRQAAWGSRPACEDHRSLERMRCGAVCRVQREEGFVPAPTHTWSNGGQGCLSAETVTISSKGRGRAGGGDRCGAQVRSASPHLCKAGQSRNKASLAAEVGVRRSDVGREGCQHT